MINTIKNIMSNITDEFVVTSAGYISRIMYHTNDRNRNFYCMGSMGCALGIAIGLASNVRSDVIAVIGDGEALMGLGSFVLARNLKLPNLKIKVLDNRMYESTGGQGTCSKDVNFSTLYYRCEVFYVDEVIESIPRINLAPEEIYKRFRKETKYE